MSKMGRQPINIGSTHVEIVGHEIRYKGKNAQGNYMLPEWLIPTLDGQKLVLKPAHGGGDVGRLWGMHRALLANAITGADKGFECQIKIVGLGFKASKSAKGLQFSLGFSHKIDFELPAGIVVDIDKTGQLLTCKSHDKELLGLTCSRIRALREPEPYKGTGIQYGNEVIRRKAGKTK